jgi:hypothetical protein
MSILRKVLSLVTGDPSASDVLRMPKNRPLKRLTERELIQRESEIGAKLFGAIPAGHRREFFCLDERTWIWHEEGKNPKTGKFTQQTIRYEIQAGGILKVQGGARYSFVEGVELNNLAAAAGLYYEQVARTVYNRDPKTGLKVA